MVMRSLAIAVCEAPEQTPLLFAEKRYTIPGK
jgi:hypothetical protein